MQVAYTNHNMDAKLTSNDLVVVATDLVSSASYHFIWNLDEIKKLRVPTCTDKTKMQNARKIAKAFQTAYELAEAGSEESEKLVINNMATEVLTHYVANCNAFEMLEPIGHNTIHIAVDFSNSGYAVRPISTTGSETVTEATENVSQVLAMAYQSGFATITKSNASGLTMIGVVTPGTRVSKPKPGAVGSNMTPKKKKRNKRK